MKKLRKKTTLHGFDDTLPYHKARSQAKEHHSSMERTQLLWSQGLQTPHTQNDAKQARIDRHTSMWKPGDSLIRPMTLVRAQLLKALEVQNLEKYRNLINCSIRILNQSTSVLSSTSETFRDPMTIPIRVISLSTLRSEECSSCSVQRQLVLKMASTQGTRPSDVTLCFKLELITNLFESLGCLGSLGSLGPV